MIPSHFVSMMNPDRKPRSHLVGTSNSMVVIPFDVFISERIPFLFQSASMVLQAFPSGTITMTDSIGSSFFQNSSLKITCGHETCSSNHSRRIVSMRTLRWSSHRHETRNTFESPASKSTFSHTFISSSLLSRSRILREVTCFPSFPANGESFTRNSILSVGSSMVIAGRGSASGKVEIVSQT